MALTSKFAHVSGESWVVEMFGTHDGLLKARRKAGTRISAKGKASTLGLEPMEQSQRHE